MAFKKSHHHLCTFSELCLRNKTLGWEVGRGWVTKRKKKKKKETNPQMHPLNNWFSQRTGRDGPLGPWFHGDLYKQDLLTLIPFL